MLRRAIESILEDKTFHIPVEPAVTVLRAAKTANQWAHEHKDRCRYLETQICSALRPCLTGGGATKSKKKLMWGTYHKVRTSEEFRLLWVNVLAEMEVQSVVPAFYQAITDAIFKELITIDTQVTESELSLAQPITYEDANVIRFAAGYVCRKVHEKIKKSRQPNRRDLLSCITELLEDEGDIDSTPSTDWIRAIDRGGLWHVKEGTYMLFYAMEEEVGHFRVARVQEMGNGYSNKVVKSILSSDDVQFHWCMLSAEMGTREAEVVLEMIVTLWTTIRGFSFASAWVEL